MSRLTRDGTAEPASRDKILRRERGQRNIPFPCSADHEQDWRPHPIDPYSCLAISDNHIEPIYTYICQLFFFFPCSVQTASPVKNLVVKNLSLKK